MLCAVMWSARLGCAERTRERIGLVGRRAAKPAAPRALQARGVVTF